MKTKIVILGSVIVGALALPCFRADHGRPGMMLNTITAVTQNHEKDPMKKLTFRAIGTMIVLALTAIQSLAQSTYQPYTFTTLAGGGGFNSPDVLGSAVRFRDPLTVAVDSAGNVYVADWANNTIRKMTPVGTNWVVTTAAGLAGSFGSANGTNSDVRFNIPAGVAMDSADNVYVADVANNLIRKMTLAGTNWVVTTLAGVGGNYGSSNAVGNAALFKGPAGVTVDFYFNTIRKGYPPPMFRSPEIIAGQFVSVLTGPPGQLVVLEASSDLLTWLPIWTNTFAGDLNFSDPQSNVSSNRFYRARVP